MKPIVEIKIEKDRKQNTVILMWNPSISSYTMDRFESDFLDMAPDDFNWSIWEHAKEIPDFVRDKYLNENGVIFALRPARNEN